MPISIKRNPFNNQEPVIHSDLTIRTPQARVLAVLQPDNYADPISEWPLVTRAKLGVRAGYTAISGTVTRALNGIRMNSSSGDPHLGLIARGMVEEVILNIEGITETNYRATIVGIQAYQKHISTTGELPKLRSAVICTNDRYKKTSATS